MAKFNKHDPEMTADSWGPVFTGSEHITASAEEQDGVVCEDCEPFD